ncbi:MAG: SdpI family protein [Bdellovibrionaceae bacterium]|nr:SdpI family protein [Pseudobdellovibrionaceae bacterium]
MNNSLARISARPFAPNLLLLFFMVAASLYYANAIPELVPTQFDLQGNVTNHGPRVLVLTLLPIVYALSLFLLPFLIFGILKNTTDRMQTVVGRTNTAFGVLMTSAHLGLLMSAVSPRPGVLQNWIVSGVALFMMFLSSVFAQVEPNRFIGIRTPWTLTSLKNWNATHKFASRISAISGSLLFLATLFASPSLPLTLATLVFTMLVPVFYSLWYFQNFDNSPSTECK